MKRHVLVLLLLLAFACFGFAAFCTQSALAQDSGRSSRSDGERSEGRSWRGRYSDRGRSDSRSSRLRDDERRGEDRRSDERRSDDRSTSSSTTSTPSTSTNSPATSSSTTSSTVSSATSNESANARLKAWATEIVRKNDKNSDMILQSNEMASLGSSAAADLNRDGNITIDELVMHHTPVAAKGTTPSSPTPATSTSADPARRDTSSSGDSRAKLDADMSKRVLYGSAGGPAPAGKEANKRRSYRFTRATDKLPTGLPSWFASRDANRDGQVSMSEYSRSWSSSAADDFRRYDLNDDGIVTAKEAAKHK